MLMTVMKWPFTNALHFCCKASVLVMRVVLYTMVFEFPVFAKDLFFGGVEPGPACVS